MRDEQISEQKHARRVRQRPAVANSRVALKPAPEPHDETLASDRLPGAQAIADFIGEDVRAVYHKLERRYIPAVKEGATWVALKSRLRRFYNGDPTAAPEPKPVAQRAGGDR